MKRDQFINDKKSIVRDYASIGYSVCPTCGMIEPPEQGHNHGKVVHAGSPIQLVFQQEFILQDLL